VQSQFYGRNVAVGDGEVNGTMTVRRTLTVRERIREGFLIAISSR